MSEELVERLREPMTLGMSLKLGDASAELQAQREAAADLIERQRQFMDFCIRWAWDKDGSGTTDSEKLGCIKHHPILTDYRRSLSNKGKGDE